MSILVDSNTNTEFIAVESTKGNRVLKQIPSCADELSNLYFQEIKYPCLCESNKLYTTIRIFAISPYWLKLRIQGNITYPLLPIHNNNDYKENNNNNNRND